MKYSLLIVEDDGYVSELYTKKFEDSGFEVEAALNGEEALKLLTDGLVPDAILLDITMPRMDGIEFLKKFRSDVRWKDVVVVILTNILAQEKSQEMLELGAQAYLEKFRYTPSEILGKVKEVIVKRRS